MSDVAALVADNLNIWTGAIERKSGAGRGGGSKRISLYGIERLRALILDLAVRGKLVPQDGRDEPAMVLLDQLGLKRDRHAVPGQDTLPLGWALIAFGDYAEEIATGPFGTMIHADDYVVGGVPLINPSHMIEDRIVEDASISLPATKADELSTYKLRTGDLVFARRGEVGRLALVTERENGWLCGTGSFRARFGSQPVQPYLIKFFRSSYARSFLSGASVGATMSNLNQGILGKLPIPLPPLAEQCRIVAKVDELMAQCDALERESADALAAHQTLVETLLATLVGSDDAADLAANWTRLERNFDTLFTTETSIDALKQTILALAVRGKLVQQNAANWPVEPLGKYVKEAAAGWSPKCIETPRSGDNWGVLKVSAVTWGRFQPEENKELPSSLEPRPEFEVAPGDFLISRANTAELVARSVVVPPNAPSKLMMSDKIIRLRFNDKIAPEYVNLVHAAPLARDYYARVAGGTSSSMKNVSQSQIRALEIPIPPLPEQHSIVAKVDELMALCDALKARLSDAAETCRHLSDAIVERAAA